MTVKVVGAGRRLQASRKAPHSSSSAVRCLCQASFATPMAQRCVGQTLVSLLCGLMAWKLGQGEKGKSSVIDLDEGYYASLS